MAQNGDDHGLTGDLDAAVSAGSDLLVAAVGSTGGIDLVLLGDDGVQMLTGSLCGLEVEIDGDIAAGLTVALGRNSKKTTRLLLKQSAALSAAKLQWITEK